MYEHIGTSRRAQIGRNQAIVAAVAVVVVVATAGAVLLGGVPGDGPSPGVGNGTTTAFETTTTGSTTAGSSANSTTTATTTGSTTANSTTATSTGSTTANSTTATTTTTTSTTTNGSPQFAFQIYSIEECGSSCRDVATGLSNEGSAPAENVTVEVNVYAGNERVWRDTEDVGTLGPGETHNSTEHVEVGPREGYQIQQNGGYVTIETVVRYDGGSETFTRRKKVM